MLFYWMFVSYRGTNRKSVFICLPGIIILPGIDILPEISKFLAGYNITKAHYSY